MNEKIYLKIPSEVYSAKRFDNLDLEILEGKVVIGLISYAKAGKDSVAKFFIEQHGYTRVAFADNIKKEMNRYMKEIVFDDIDDNIEYDLTLDKIDFFTEDLELKKILRPYIIWYAEEFRRINGQCYWTNRALEDAKDAAKIIITDIRRTPELDIFRNSNEFNKRTQNQFAGCGFYPKEQPQINNYGTLLFEVSQFGLKDDDDLTNEAIKMAHEQWLIDDYIYIDPRIPNEATYRQKAMQLQVDKIAKKFGISKPDKTKHVQTNIFSV